MLRLCQLALPGMKQRGWGRIVNVSSLAGRGKSIVAGPAYMLSKSAVLGLSRSIASEMGQYGITTNCVAPGRILTPMAQQAGDEVNRRYAEQIPDRKSTRLNSSHLVISYAVFCLKKKTSEYLVQSPVYQAYKQRSPRVEDLPVLLLQLAEVVTVSYTRPDQVHCLSIPVFEVYAIV